VTPQKSPNDNSPSLIGARKRTRTDIDDDDDMPSKRARKDDLSLEKEWAIYSELMRSACSNLLQLHSMKMRRRKYGWGGNGMPSNRIRGSGRSPTAPQGIRMARDG
jgi:hypothetical protein